MEVVDLICQVNCLDKKNYCIEIIGEELRCNELNSYVNILKQMFSNYQHMTYTGCIYDYDNREVIDLTDREYNISGIGASYLIIDNKTKCKPERYRFNIVKLYFRGDNFA